MTSFTGDGIPTGAPPQRHLTGLGSARVARCGATERQKPGSRIGHGCCDRLRSGPAAAAREYTGVR